MIPIRIAKIFFSDLGEKKMLKFTWKHKKPQMAKDILNNKNKARSITIPDCQTYYSVVVIKTAW